MQDLSKYIRSESVTINRSDIKLADYNPRIISEENLKTLRRGIRKYGLVGGIVVNKRTGNTLVQGHQRIKVMDDLQKYNPDTHENDYAVRCELIDYDEKTEKELVILLNNPNAQGQWDYDRLRAIVPEIDYKDAGLTDADLSMIGVDFMMPTVGDKQTEADIAQMILPDLAQTTSRTDISPDDSPASYEEKKQHMKEVKEQVRQQAAQQAADNFAYLTLSFDTFANMADFLDMFGFTPDTQIIKGEELAAMILPENEE